MIKVFAGSAPHEAQGNALAARLENKTDKFISISVGAEAAKNALAKKRNGAFAISILDPQKNHDEFDLIFLPMHEPYKAAHNIVPVIGLFNSITPRPENDGSVAVLIGGKHVGGNFTESDAENMAALTNIIQAPIRVTTSRRTEIAATKKLRQAMKHDAFYDYNYDQHIENPYQEMLARAGSIIVTADSLRMISEACSSGKNVYIYTPQQTHFSYIAFRDLLFSRNYALSFNSEDLPDIKTKILDETGRAVEIILGRLSQS